MRGWGQLTRDAAAGHKMNGVTLEGGRIRRRDLDLAQHAVLDSLFLRSEIAAIKAGFELAGTYRCAVAGTRYVDEALTTCDGIGSFIAGVPRMKGVKYARRVLANVQDGSHSEGETSMALMLTGSRRIGGIALPRGVLNWRVRTPDGVRYVDLGFPGKDVGVEYKGRRYHPQEKARIDDRRVNKLSSTGISIFNVWHEDLARPELFSKLVRDIARTLGVRARIRSKEFSVRQSILRSCVLPPVTRYDEFLMHQRV